MRVVVILLALVGCGAPSSQGSGTLQGRTGAGPTGVDEDGDGSLVEDDCDDLDPASHPLGVEVACDGRDNDCDGADERAGCDVDFATAELVIPIPGDLAGDGVVGSAVYLTVVPDLTGDGLQDFTTQGVLTTGWSEDALHGWAPGALDPMGPAFQVAGVQFHNATVPGDLTGDGQADIVANPRLGGRETNLYAGPLAGVVPVGEQPLLSALDRFGASMMWDSDGDGEAELLTYQGGWLLWAAPPFYGLSPGDTAWASVDPREDTGIPSYLPQLGRVDLDGDGNLEIVAANVRVPGYFGQSDDGLLHILQGTPTPGGDWAVEVASFWQDSNHGWAWGDFDADGYFDVAGISDGTLSIQVAYGPFPLNGQVAMNDIAELTLEGATGTLALVPDTDGDGAPELLFGCEDRVVLAALNVRGRVRDACSAGRTFIGMTSPMARTVEFSSWFAGGDFDGDGLGDLVITEFPEEGIWPARFLVWFGGR